MVLMYGVPSVSRLNQLTTKNPPILLPKCDTRILLKIGFSGLLGNYFGCGLGSAILQLNRDPVSSQMG